QLSCVVPVGNDDVPELPAMAAAELVVIREEVRSSDLLAEERGVRVGKKQDVDGVLGAGPGRDALQLRLDLQIGETTVMREAVFGGPDGPALSVHARVSAHAVACEAPKAGHVGDERAVDFRHSRTRPAFTHEEEYGSWPLHDRPPVVTQLTRRQGEWRADLDAPVVVIHGDGGRLRTMQDRARGLSPPACGQATERDRHQRVHHGIPHHWTLRAKSSTTKDVWR